MLILLACKMTYANHGPSGAPGINYLAQGINSTFTHLGLNLQPFC